MTRQRNLFISHSWTYTDAYQKFCNLLDKAPRFTYRNYSVPKDDPIHNAANAAALYEAIKAQMVFCEVIIIMAGKYATFRKWINNELRIAKHDFNKPVLAVKPWASTQVSTVVRNNADLLVNWNSSSIVTAIRSLAP